MSTLQDYITQVEQLVHDVSGVDYTTAEMTSYVNSGRKRTALDLHCVRQWVQGMTLIPQQEQYPINGVVVGGTITAGGSGYVNPTVTISAPQPGGTQATAIAIVTGGAVTAIQMTNWGLGYISGSGLSITMNIVGGGGVGAQVTPLTLTKVFDWASASILNGNLRYTASWLPFTWFQAFCRAYVLQQRPPAVWTIHDGAQRAVFYPIPDQAYPFDLDCVTLPDDLVNLTDVDIQVIPPVDDCVQYYGAYKALLKLQNFEQAAFYLKAYKDRVLDMQSGRQVRRIISPYRTFYRRTSRL